MLNLCFVLCQGNKVALSHASLYANSVLSIYILSFHICFCRVLNLKGAITTLAIYDHITSTLQHHSYFVSEPLVRLKRKTSRKSQEKDGERALPEQDLQEREYVLDSAPPTLTLGVLNTTDMIRV